MDKLPIAFWIFVLLGVALVVVAYILDRTKKQERFSNAPATPATTAPTAPAAPATPTATPTAPVYAESRAEIPQADSLVFYLTTFSSDVEGAAPGAAPLYSAPMNKWKNWCSRSATGAPATDYDFSLSPLSGMMPAQIKGTGLPIKNIRMYGPSSWKLVASSFPYTLSAFSLILYGKMRTFTFDTAAPMILWKAHLENPDAMQLAIHPIEGDDKNVIVRLVLGRANIFYDWTIPATNLIGSGPATPYGLVYDPATKMAYFYVGLMRYRATLQTGAANRVGNSLAEINSDGRLDATLYAVMYYNRALPDADMAAIGIYLAKQQSGLPATIQQQQMAATAMIDAYKTEIQTTTKTVEDLSSQLNQCKSALDASAALAAKGEPREDQALRWQIKAPSGAATGFIDPETLKKCTPLVINTYGNTGAVPPKTPAEAKVKAETKPETKAEGPKKISYPPDSLTKQISEWIA